jgi:hypothetical protein
MPATAETTETATAENPVLNKTQKLAALLWGPTAPPKS